ncbi:MAG TPA: ferritin [Candidatus Sumerlaeota bacterium]|nr:ferritin [Candidatus Sumerlaeota bacterium]HPS00020.1 ferritin [Candidatus Sumerlaeota bacterium]
MLSGTMQAALNSQLNAELFSSYLYLSMAANLESKNLKGMSHWFQVQAQEEMIHALKFYNFILDRGGKVNLAAIEGPQTDWAMPLLAFLTAQEHEAKVTGLINNLVDLAITEKDHASNAFLQWFVTEQVEEEASVLAVVESLKLSGDDSSGLFMIDKDLALRPQPNLALALGGGGTAA